MGPSDYFIDKYAEIANKIIWLGYALSSDNDITYSEKTETTDPLIINKNTDQTLAYLLIQHPNNVRNFNFLDIDLR